MNKDDAPKMTELDCLVSSEPIQLMKAILPFLPPQGQQFVSIYAKAMEMRNTIQTFQNQRADMSMCSLPSSRTDLDPLQMIQEIRDYCGPATRQKMDQCMDLAAMMELANLFQNNDSEKNQ